MDELLADERNYIHEYVGVRTIEVLAQHSMAEKHDGTYLWGVLYGLRAAERFSRESDFTSTISDIDPKNWFERGRRDAIDETLIALRRYSRMDAQTR